MEIAILKTKRKWGSSSVPRYLILCFLFFFSAIVLAQNSIQLRNWNTTTPWNKTRSSHTSAVYNGYLYVIGGGNGDTLLNDVQYAHLNPDGSLGTWQNTTSFSIGRCGHSSVVNNGYLYIIGGTSGNSVPLNDIQYAKINVDGSLGAWQTTTSFPNARWAHTSVVYNGYLYIIQGFQYSAAAPLSDIEYAPINADGTIGTWQSTTSFSPARWNHESIVYNGHIYSMGGDNWNGSYYSLNDIQYSLINADGSLSAWQSTTVLNPALDSFGLVKYNNFLIITGGGIPQIAGKSNAVKYIGINSNATLGNWQNMTSFSINRHGHTSVVYNGYLYVIGGQDSLENALNDVQYAKIIPQNFTWTIGISSSANGMIDSSCYLGTAYNATDGFDSAYDLPKPTEPPSNYVYTYFPHPEWNSILGSNFTTDIRRDTDLTVLGKTWNFSITTDQHNKSMTMQFTLGNEIPSGDSIMLKDMKTGTIQNLRANNSYTYNTGTDASRSFQILIGNVPPSVASSTPTRNALNVAKNTTITATFSENISFSTLTNSTIKINGSISGSHTASYSYNSTLQTVTLAPITPFKVGEVVTITLTSGIKSVMGDSLANAYTWSFTTKSNRASGLFAQSSTDTVGIGPGSATRGDFNGDGFLDLAVANFNSNTVYILLNNGKGTFTRSSIVNVGTNPYAISTADFNGDGYPDLAVANYSANTVYILLNNGNGTFTQSSIITVGNNPRSIAVGDFNGDGYLDLAVADENSNMISILFNNGDGTFTQSSTIGVGSRPHSITVGDFNGDGFPDLAVANGGTNTVSILLNNGNGVFTMTSTPIVGNNPLSITTGDFNGDGYIDLAVPSSGSNIVSILLNNGNGTFAQSSTISVINPYTVTTGDFNGDGFLDLAVTNYTPNTVSILLNNGSGTFTQGYNAGMGGDPQVVIAGDFNGDGFLDLAVTNLDNNTVSILLNNIPAAPQNLTAKAGNGQVTLKWNKNIEADFLKYRIYMGSDSLSMTLKDSSTASFLDTTKIIAGFTNGTTYYFRISAIDSAGLESGQSSAVSIVPSIVPTGLVAYYPFNGNTNDGSGNGNNGTNYGATLSTDRFGNSSSAYSFNGINNYIETINTFTNLSGNNPKTIIAWFKLDHINDEGPIVNIGQVATTGSNPGFCLSTTNYYYSDTLLYGWGGDYMNLLGKTSLELNKWYFACYTYDGSNARLYLNNKLEGILPILLNTSVASIVIGKSTGVVYYFDGAIDDISIYNRALSQPEIAELYHEGSWGRPNIPRNLTAISSNGQVTLKWNQNTEPDILRYRIYKGIISGGELLIDSSSASVTDTTKTITGLANGTTYYFKVTAVDSIGLESIDSTEVSAIPIAPYSFSPGWSLMGIPVQMPTTAKESIIDSSQSVYLYGYSGNGGYWYTDSLRFGRGYWLGALTTATATVSGLELSDSVVIPLNTGWNIIALPFVDSSYSKELITIDSSGVEENIDSAIASNGWITPIMSPTTYPDTLSTWQGYWICANDSLLELIFKPPTGRIGSIYNQQMKVAGKKIKKAALTAQNWEVKIILKAGKAVDGLGEFGVKLGAKNGYDSRYDYPHPPAAPGGASVTAGFSHPEWKQAGGTLFSTDIRPPGSSLVWNLRTSCSPKPIVATLAWDSTAIPSGVGLELTDYGNGGKQVNMNTKGSYTFELNGTDSLMITEYVTSVEGKTSELPKVFGLSQNYPNPFNPTTTIEYQLPIASTVTMKIYDMLGREAATLVNQKQEAGTYSMTFDGTRYSSGVYFYRIIAVSMNRTVYIATKKLLLLK